MPSDRPPPFDLISGTARNEGAITTSSCLSRPLLPIIRSSTPCSSPGDQWLRCGLCCGTSSHDDSVLTQLTRPSRSTRVMAYVPCLTFCFYLLLFFATCNWVLSGLGDSHVRDVVGLTIDRKSYSVVSMSPSEPSPRPSCSTDSTNLPKSPARNHGFPASFRNTPPRRRSLRRETRSTRWLWKRLPLTVTCSRARAPGKPLS